LIKVQERYLERIRKRKMIYYDFPPLSQPVNPLTLNHLKQELKKEKEKREK